MPFVANTPESLISRSDSRNPATTCRGITSSGRPCRRPVSGSDPMPTSNAFLKANLRVGNPRDERLYCWQHKEQASLSARSSPGPRASGTPILEERTSLDTLADRLGLVGRTSTKLGKRPKDDGKHRAGHDGRKDGSLTGMSRSKPKKQAVSCCCFRIPVEEISPPPRPKPRPLQPPSSISPARPTTISAGKKTSSQRLAPLSTIPSDANHQNTSSTRRHASHTLTHSATSSQAPQYLSLIPTSASPQTASLLLAELAKPISQQDEPGYIYIFWLTPESKPASPTVAETARSLLTPPVRPSTGRRRTSDVLASFAISEGASSGGGSHGGSQPSQSNNASDKKRILLKIGRANNVQRRLNEWQRQCGHHVSLIRYYPYIPTVSTDPPASSPASTPTSQPRKMPHSHKVERLIHIELAGLGLRISDRERCAACGREHREWFAVDATRRAVAAVDEVVRRWVEWDEALGQ